MDFGKQNTKNDSKYFLNMLKRPRGNEVVNPTDHDFIYFSIFRLFKVFFHQISYESSENLNNLFVYLNTAKGRLNIPTALGHVLILSGVWQTISAAGKSPMS